MPYIWSNERGLNCSAGELESRRPVIRLPGSPRMWKRIRSKAVIGAALVLMADARPEPVEGRWLTEPKTAVVEILRCDGGSLCGRLLWFRMKPSDHNPQALDIRNPDPGLRNRPLCGLMVMWGFSTGRPEPVERRFALRSGIGWQLPRYDAVAVRWDPQPPRLHRHFPLRQKSGLDTLHPDHIRLPGGVAFC